MHKDLKIHPPEGEKRPKKKKEISYALTEIVTQALSNTVTVNFAESKLI